MLHHIKAMIEEEGLMECKIPILVFVLLLERESEGVTKVRDVDII